MLTAGSLCLAVLAAVRGSTGYRLEGQIFDDKEAEDIQEVSTEKAFESRVQAQSDNDDECQLAVSSSKKRRNRCECPDGLMVTCPGEPCNAHSQSFAPTAFAGRSCHCATCDISCEAVPGAKTRTSRWKHVTGRDCECDLGLFLAGDDASCKGRGKKNQYFKSKRVADRGCFCTMGSSDAPDQEHISAVGEKSIHHGSAPSADHQEEKAEENKAATVQGHQEKQAEEGAGQKQQMEQGEVQEKDEEEPTGVAAWYKKHPELRTKAIYGLCGVVLAALIITTIYRVFRIAAEIDEEHEPAEDVGRAGSEASVSRAGSEVQSPPQDVGAAQSAAN